MMKRLILGARHSKVVLPGSYGRGRVLLFGIVYLFWGAHSVVEVLPEGFRRFLELRSF
jgi:hypothetical protein